MNTKYCKEQYTIFPPYFSKHFYIENRSKYTQNERIVVYLNKLIYGTVKQHIHLDLYAYSKHCVSMNAIQLIIESSYPNGNMNTKKEHRGSPMDLQMQNQNKNKTLREKHTQMYTHIVYVMFIYRCYERVSYY